MVLGSLAISDDGRPTIGPNVRRLRKAKGWGQPELAAEAGLSAQTISNVEPSRRPTAPGTEAKIATALGVSAALGYQVELRTWADLGVFGAVRGRRILVARTQAARVRWTIAHELGHVAIGNRAGHDSEHAEALANRVAGALLIPRTLVAAGPIDLPSLAARCGTSLEGTAHRLLDLVPSAVAVAERRRPPRARVSRLSPAAPAPLALEIAEAALSRRAPQEGGTDGWHVAAWPTPAATRAVAFAAQL